MCCFCTGALGLVLFQICNEQINQIGSPLLAPLRTDSDSSVQVSHGSSRLTTDALALKPEDLIVQHLDWQGRIYTVTCTVFQADQQEQPLYKHPLSALMPSAVR